MTKCAARADAFLTSSSPSVLLRSLILRRPRSFAVLFTFLPEGSERDETRTNRERTADVVRDHGKGTDGRRSTSCPLSPSRLPLRAHFHRERDVWVTEDANRRRHLRIAVTRKSSSWSPLSHVLSGKRRAICTTSVSSQIFRIG